jgi:NarL family two-component system response regulator LiaR
MIRIIVLWALVLAAGAFALEWLQYQYLVRLFSEQIYIAIIAAGFAAGGIWVGWKLTARPAPGPFARNDAALTALGLTGQEMKVLVLLAAGQSNKEIAQTLGLSPNTVKTHIANLFAKLEVGAPQPGGEQGARAGAHPLNLRHPKGRNMRIHPFGRYPDGGIPPKDCTVQTAKEHGA